MDDNAAQLIEAMMDRAAVGHLLEVDTEDVRGYVVIGILADNSYALVTNKCCRVHAISDMATMTAILLDAEQACQTPQDGL